jgi:hypothetical protein
MTMVLGVDGFVMVPWSPPHKKKMSSFPILSMGGYYSEPSTDDNDSTTLLSDHNSHMVFGVRCIERTVDLQCNGRSDISHSRSNSITLLQPIVENHNDDADDDDGNNNHHHQAWSEWVFQREVQLSSYLLQQPYHWEGVPVTVLEDGLYRTGLVGLAVQQYGGAHVTAVSTHFNRLQIIQASHLFHKTSTSTTSSSLQTGKCMVPTYSCVEKR